MEGVLSHVLFDTGTSQKFVIAEVADWETSTTFLARGCFGSWRWI